MEERDGLVLGIDMGTTSVKVSVYDPQQQKSLGSWSRVTTAYISSDIGNSGREQDVSKIISALQLCIKRDVPQEYLQRISAIGVCGQMHGVVVWKKNCGWSWEDSHVTIDSRHVMSHLYTWEDSRCTPEFICSLPKPETHLRQSTGYGCSTLFWLVRNRPSFLDGFDCAGTIQDFVVAMLCNLSQSQMCAQNAASWGYFNTILGLWNKEQLSSAKFPTRLLPDVVLAGTVVGHSTSEWFCIPQGVPVLVAMGDLQCSILSKLERATDAIMNISTSAQLTIRMPTDFQPPQDVDNSKEAIEFVPFFDGLYLAEAPSLNGGNVFANFVRTIRQWTCELGVDLTEEEIWKRIDLIEESLQSVACSPESGNSNAANENLPQLKIRTTIFSERHDLDARGLVSNIMAGNGSLRDIYVALSVGIIQNLHDMMPLEFLQVHEITRIIGMGTALTKNSTMQKEVCRLFGRGKERISLVMGEAGDAAVGAAMAAARATRRGGSGLISAASSEQPQGINVL